MKIIQKWQIVKENYPISACAIDTAHDQIMIGCGKSIIILDVHTGSEIKRCEKHSGDITCLAYRKDGKWFASGGYIYFYL
jgi:WD40 repeat protein